MISVPLLNERPSSRPDALCGRLAKAILIVLVAVAGHSIHAQSGRDVIRGRVTTDSGVVISGADIMVTLAPTVVTIRQQSDSTGQFAVSIDHGTGEYLIYIGAIGRRPFRRRITRVGGDTTFIVDAQLAPLVTTVGAVRVQAIRSRPTSSFGSDGAVGNDGMNKSVDGVTGALPPDLVANLDAMATLIPGLSTSTAGISAFGLGSSANSATLNGLSFSGGDMPRDARTTTRFQTSPWDPSLGGFAGVRASRTLLRGGNIAGRSAHVTVDHPALQVSDPVASRIGQKFSNLSLNLGGSGAYRLDELFYNYGAQLSRRTVQVASLADLDPTALALVGVSRDSASRLLQLLGTQGVPVRSGVVSSARIMTSASFAERIDHALPQGPPGAIPKPSWSLTGFGSYVASAASSLSPAATPGTAGDESRITAFVQGTYSRLLGANSDIANAVSSSLSVTALHSTPRLRLPAGEVLIASTLADGNAGLGALKFGGGSMMTSDTRTWTWELVNQTDLLAGGHASFPIKLYLQSLVGGFSAMPASDQFGSFAYQSLSALESNTPSSFARTLFAPTVSGGEWLGAGAGGGTYSHGSLSVTGGLRADVNVFLARPEYNERAASLLGTRTDHVPNSFGLSPRLGFVWRYTGAGSSGMGTPLGSLGRGPTQLRGGLGRFRSVLPPSLIADATSATGLPGGEQSLSCIGSAVPTPDWTGYSNGSATIPTHCLGLPNFNDSAPSIQVYDKDYRPQDSWHATLGWTTTMFGTTVALDATYALNLHQPGTRDLNFSGTPRFTLTEEAARPVFVSVASIAPASGTISPVESRSTVLFGRVSDHVSDLRGDARQLTVYALPKVPIGLGLLALSYSWADARVQARGFDENTAGNPRAVEWARPTYTPRHQFKLQAAHSYGSRFGLTTFITATSGLPFTPMIAGDVNGDGAANDRAFVFDPAAIGDSTVATGLRTLLQSGSPSARECLRRQLGRVAARNSCTGPWSATMNASVVVYPTLPGTNRRGRMNVTLVNVLGGIDAAIHGATHLRGWGMIPLPDETLLRVRAFDPTARRFAYVVNPRFGSVSQSTTMRRAPFRISIDFSLDVGRSYDAQRLEQNLRLRPALVGTRAPLDSVKKRYMENFSDFYGYLLTREMSDSMALSIDQMRQMQQERQVLRQKADSIYTSLATYLLALKNGYDRDEALANIKMADESVWTAIYAERTFLLKLLTPGQLRLLPTAIFQMIENPNYRTRFFFGY